MHPMTSPPRLVAPPNAALHHAMLRKRTLLRPVSATNNAGSDLSDAEGLTDIDDTVQMAVGEQGLEGDTQVDAAVTTEPTVSSTSAAPQQQASGAAKAAQPQRLVRASVSPEFVEKAKFAGMVVAGAAVVGGMVFMLRKVADQQMPKMQKVYILGG